jgi:hypothetical protein
MIVGGTSHSGRGLGAYLTQDKNEKVEVWELQSGRQDLSKALEDWRAYAHGTKAELPLYHAWLRPSDTDRALNREDWDKSIKLFEQEMGFEGQPRAVVYHHGEGKGEQGHIHLVYSRIQENGKAVSDSWNYVHHEKARVQIETDLNLEHVYSPHLDRNEPRRAQGLNHDQMQQGERLKIDPREVKAEVSELYKQAEGNGREFVAALEKEGYSLAQGDKRGYVILDEAGGVHSLSRMAGVKVAELRETLQDYPLRDLPSVETAREMQLERQQPASELEKAAEVTKTAESNERTEDAPVLGRRDDYGSEGMNLGAGAFNAVADSVEAVGGAVLDLLCGDGKPPPTPEEQKAANLRAERIAAAQESLKRYEFEAKQRQEREQDQGLGLSLDRDRGRER